MLKGSFLAAYDAKTGAELWKTERGDVPTWSSPTVVDEGGAPQVVVNGFKQMGGYDLATGKPRWWLGRRRRHSGAHPGCRRRPDLPRQRPRPGLADLRGQGLGQRRPQPGRRQDRRTNAWPGPIPKARSYMQTPLLYGGLLYVCKRRRGAHRLPGGDRRAGLPAAPGRRPDRLHRLGGGRRRQALLHRRDRRGFRGQGRRRLSSCSAKASWALRRSPPRRSPRAGSISAPRAPCVAIAPPPPPAAGPPK